MLKIILLALLLTTTSMVDTHDSVEMTETKVTTSTHQQMVKPLPLALLGFGLISLSLYMRANKYKQH